MAERPTSLLLFDHASVRRSLNRIIAGAGNRLGPRAATWVGALESGEIVSPSTRRRFGERRCYAEDGDGFADAGFEIIRVGGRTGVSADVQIAIDAIDALAEDGFDEVVLMMTGGAVVPILRRLNNAGRRAVVLADGSAGDRSEEADGTVSADDLAALLMPDAGVKPEPVDREEIETFARKVASATNVPLLSPRAYAQLFGCLAEEITENGYDFRSTAQNVTDRLAELGRKIPRRQVVFVVKGLALKGHVFTVGETAHHLAEVFGEQVRYLMEQSGIVADETTDRLLDAWLTEKAGAPIRRPAPPEVKRPGAEARRARETEKPAAQPRRTDEAKPRPAPERRRAEPPAPAAPKPEARPEPPQSRRKAAMKPVARRPVEPAERKPANARPADPVPAEPVAATQKPVTKSVPGMRSAEQIKTEIAARIAAAVEERRAAARARSTGTDAPPPPVERQREPEAEPGDSGVEEARPSRPARKRAVDAPLESSILAAIAEAVDVLVDSDRSGEAAGDGGAGAERPRRRTDDAAARPSAPERQPEADPDPAEADPEPAEAEPEPGDDIGDEIQRIIASFGRRERE